jgi:xanthine dehydrogenase YagS FAD-binding subunit
VNSEPLNAYGSSFKTTLYGIDIPCFGCGSFNDQSLRTRINRPRSGIAFIIGFAAEGENQFHCIFGSDDQCFIVHPSDTAPALAALNARVHIAGPEGERYVPVESFHVLPAEDVQRETVLVPGEIVTDVVLPAPPAGLRSTYRKVRARRSWDFALALALQFDGRRVVNGRVVASGAAPIPWRSRAVEDVIRGRVIDDPLIAAASDALVEDAEPLLNNQYKIPLFRGVIEEELSAMAVSECSLN